MRFGGNHVVGLAAREKPGDGDDCGVERVERAADHGLQGLHQGRARDQRIARLLRHGGVAALAREDDVELIGAGHHRAVVHGELASGQARPVVHAEHRFHGKALEQTLLDHYPRAAVGFLRGLKDEDHRADEVAATREFCRRAQQHGGVAVMAASVHAAFVPRAVREPVLLDDGQGVQIGAQADAARSASFVVAIAQHAHHARARQATMHFQTQGLQVAGHHIAAAMLREGQFRMRVQVVAQGDEAIHQPGMTCFVTATEAIQANTVSAAIRAVTRTRLSRCFSASVPRPM